MISLQKPCMRYKESFLQAWQEFAAEGDEDYLAGIHEIDPFEAYLQKLDRESRGFVTPGRVPQTTYWMVASETFVGRISVRHNLNPKLVLLGGHIGYSVRPTARRKGYGKRALALCLDETRRLGLLRVLLTCDDSNAASAKIIESCGGELVDKIDNEGRESLTRRYWIDLA